MAKNQQKKRGKNTTPNGSPNKQAASTVTESPPVKHATKKPRNNNSPDQKNPNKAKNKEKGQTVIDLEAVNDGENKTAVPKDTDPPTPETKHPPKEKPSDPNDKTDESNEQDAVEKDTPAQKAKVSFEEPEKTNDGKTTPAPKDPPAPPVPPTVWYPAAMELAFPFDNTDNFDRPGREKEFRIKIDEIANIMKTHGFKMTFHALKPHRHPKAKALTSFNKANVYSSDGTGLPLVSIYTSPNSFSTKFSRAYFPFEVKFNAPWSIVRSATLFDIKDFDLQFELSRVAKETAIPLGIFMPSYQNLDKEALMIYFWENFQILIEIKALSHHVRRNDDGSPKGKGTFEPASPRSKLAIGHGPFVNPKDYAHAKTLLHEKFPMKILTSLSDYPLGIRLSIYPFDKQARIHHSVIAAGWKEEKLTDAAHSDWKHSINKATSGGGMIESQMFASTNALNVPLKYLKKNKTTTARIYILSLQDNQTGRPYYQGLDPSFSRVNNKDFITCRFTAFRSRLSVQEKVCQNALSLLSILPDKMLKLFGNQMLENVLADHILAQANADGDIPAALIPAMDSKLLSFDLQFPDDESIDKDSAYKVDIAEDMDAMSALSERTAGTKHTSATGATGKSIATTASTRVKLVNETLRADEMQVDNVALAARNTLLAKAQEESKRKELQMSQQVQELMDRIQLLNADPSQQQIVIASPLDSQVINPENLQLPSQGDGSAMDVDPDPNNHLPSAPTGGEANG